MGSFSSKNEKCVNIETNDIPEEYIMIIQHTRKNLMLKQFNECIKNTDNNSVYHKHYVNTKEIESAYGITKEYIVRSTIFFTLWRSINVINFENTTEWIN